MNFPRAVSLLWGDWRSAEHSRSKEIATCEVCESSLSQVYSLVVFFFLNGEW